MAGNHGLCGTETFGRFDHELKVVIGHYYRERHDNLFRIIQTLNDYSIRPVIWNNSGIHIRIQSLECDIVDSPNNPIHGRYLSALIYPEADIFLFQDDDLVLNNDTIERLITSVTNDESLFHGIEGRNLAWNTGSPYRNALPARLPDSHADMVIRAYACHRRALAYGLQWILDHGIHPGRAETALFTLRRSRLVEETTWEDLPEHGIGLCYASNHDSEIDDFIHKWMLD